ncbi:MAG: cell envelope integrity protein CreD [Deltaproteobacteria bacterium]|nr:cell envelope integrity protein CreD [Deltaproteobacteria bacterium]
MTDSHRAGDGAPASPEYSPAADPAFVPRNPLHGRLPSFNLGQRFSGPLARCLFVGALTLFLLIPLGFVRDVVYDRMYLYQEATANITSNWGKTQTVSGPALIIPYRIWKDRKEMVTVKVEGKDQTQEVVTRDYYLRHKVVLPSDLSFATEMNPEVRYRGIYRQALYNAPVDVAGTFTLPGPDDFPSNLQEVHWDKTWMSVGITDLKTISEAAPARWGTATLPAYKPGTDAGYLLGSGFHTQVPLGSADAGTKRDFSLKLRIRGSGGIYFTPVGENTTITMNGSWPSPSFQGNLLPVERSISDRGFSAKWSISNLTRTYPQIADLGGPEYSLKNSADASAITAFSAGVNLHEPVTLYRMVRRSVDYGILFIAVTFVALFAFEMVSRQRMHLVQYGMVGLSMSLFYLVLLSLAEHVSFGTAFVAASAVTVAMNAWYVGAVLQSGRKGILMGGLLTGLYAVLFSLLRMEDFSLLMGTGLVLVMMGALMFATRKLPQTRSAGTA